MKSKGSLCRLWGSICVVAFFLAIAGVATTSNAATLNDDLEFFEAKVRPLLANHCLSCHGPDDEPGGGLRLDSKAGWEIGGESGKAIIPSDPENSLLIHAVRWSDSKLQMPPENSGGKLSASEIATLEQWVSNGAFDPRLTPEKVSGRRPWHELYNERLHWWSLRPITRPNVPTQLSQEWSSSLDRFTYEKMVANKIEPAELASAATLIRRATMVLTGLPPSRNDVQDFMKRLEADPDKAYTEYVDRLIDSPQFGERFARHWLDVVRFTETHGNEWNYDVPYAWRYRDYVIRAFNSDLPYDQFVREHIAGDLIVNPRRNADGQFLESPIGTAFYRFGEVNHDSCVQFGIIGYDIVDNQIDTLSKAFQASTIACARCHDHKMDAVSSVDYHALLASLRSSRSVQRTIDVGDVNAKIIDELVEVKKQLRGEIVKQWRHDCESDMTSRLAGVVSQRAAENAKKAKESKEPKQEAPDDFDPMRVASKLASDFESETAKNRYWTELTERFKSSVQEAGGFNEKNFHVVADFRHEVPQGWIMDGMGLRGGLGRSGDIAIARDGDRLVKAVLPSGLYTFAVSDRMNGALRSPTLKRTHKKISFEVLGGRFSLARIVFNNCQFNYNHQHSIHHDQWTWITIDFPENTDQLTPYIELLTYWDNPKFPDPLGTLGKDTENQRSTFDEHSKDPSTWWGLRRIVAHDCDQPPRDDQEFLAALYGGATAPTQSEFLSQIASAISGALQALESDMASEADLKWIQWGLHSGVLSSGLNANADVLAVGTKYRELERTLRPPTLVPTLADESPAISQPLLPRGDYTKPGMPVAPGYIEALRDYTPKIMGDGSGRREIAEAITHPDNPLTSRVIVNRIWQWVFGEGIVATPDDFGHLGEAPSNQELLDFLASDFRDHGWSMKYMVRQMVLSRTFRSMSSPTASGLENDPSNRLFSHFNARRGEAELIRDTILKVSGRLDSTLYGPSILPYREKADSEKRLFVGPLDGNGRRSLYIKFQLMEAPHFLSAFNMPGGKIVQGKRETSNVPSQSLALLNDPFVHAMAKNWSEAIVKDDSPTIETRCERLLFDALSHPPSSVQRTQLVALVNEMATQGNVPESELLANQPLWQSVAHTLINLKEFIFIP